MTASSGRSTKKRTAILRRIAEEIRSSHRFLIASHENPEGDAIGSIVALGLALKDLGKEVVVLNQDPIPEAFSFLPGVEEVVHRVPADGSFDVAFALDCGDKKRLGEEFTKVQKIRKVINIDHHISNNHFGDINLVDPEASAACEIIFDLLRVLSVPVSPGIAENIYVGILTDTGSFHYSNTSPKTFAVARMCLLAGVEPWKVAEKVYENQPLLRLRLLSLVLKTLEVVEGGRISWVWVTQQMMEETGATKDMTEDFINLPRSLKGVEVALLLREVSPVQYRVSLRSRGSVDVARIALAFQGGGHPNAAGCTVEGTLSEVKSKVLEQVKAVL